MIEKLKERIDRIEVTPAQWIIAFACIIIIRCFLEALSSPSSSGIIASDAPTLIHYSLFYSSIALASMLVFQYALPTWKKSLPVIALFGLTVMFAPPIIDLLASSGKGMSMAYIVQSPAAMVYSFLTFFGPFVTRGATIGIRVELAAVFIGVGAIVYYVRKSIWRSLVTMLVLYAVVFVSGTMPGMISAVAGLFSGSISDPNQFLISSILHSSTLANNIHGTLLYSSFQRLLEIGFDFMMGRVWFLVSVGLAIAWFFTNLKRQTKAVFGNSRPERTARYIFLVLLGALIAYHQGSFSMNWNDWLALATLSLSFYFSWMYAIYTNDIFDVKIDLISNSHRPMPNGSLSLSEMRSVSLLFLVPALIGAYLSGYYAFFCVLFFNAAAYLYSVPPLRLKRVPLVSALVVAICCLSTVMAGFFTFSSSKEISAFPVGLIAGIVCVFFLAEHMKDIKDAEGDRVAGVMTIPNMLGPVWGVRVVGMLAALAYLIVPLVAGRSVIFVGSIPAAAITYWLAVRKPYVERPIFIVCGLFVIFLGAVFFGGF